MKRFNQILFVTAADLEAEGDLARAVALAERCQAALKVVTVVEALATTAVFPGIAITGAQVQTALVNEQRRYLESLASPWQERLAIRVEVLVGTTALAVIQEVLRHGHDLVLKVACPVGRLDRLLGTEDMQLMRKCPCPVWLVKRDAPASVRCVLAAVDVGDFYPPAELETRQALNLLALELAASVALAEFAELHLVHVWSAIGEGALRGAFVGAPEEQVQAYVEAIRTRYELSLERLVALASGRLGQAVVDFLKPQRHLLKGSPLDEIPALAGRIGADLVVLGTVARTGIPGLIMGNTAEYLLHRLDCSVLALKPPGFVCPITVADDTTEPDPCT